VSGFCQEETDRRPGASGRMTAHPEVILGDEGLGIDGSRETRRVRDGLVMPKKHNAMLRFRPSVPCTIMHGRKPTGSQATTQSSWRDHHPPSSGHDAPLIGECAATRGRDQHAGMRQALSVRAPVLVVHAGADHHIALFSTRHTERIIQCEMSLEREVVSNAA
jgi:hypothetical protein